MGKKNIEDQPDFSGVRTPIHPSNQIVAVVYGDGRKVTIEEVGDAGLREEMKQYLFARNEDLHLDAPFELRERAADVAEHRRNEMSEKNRRPGPRKAQAVTKEDLLTFRDEYMRNEGKERGWKKAASREFNIAVETITARVS